MPKAASRFRLVIIIIALVTGVGGVAVIALQMALLPRRPCCVVVCLLAGNMDHNPPRNTLAGSAGDIRYCNVVLSCRPMREGEGERLLLYTSVPLRFICPKSPETVLQLGRVFDLVDLISEFALKTPN